jgi:hypothetical protein
MGDTYWAAAQTEEFHGEATKRIDEFYDFLKMSGRWRLWENCHRAWHTGAKTLGEMQQAGERGELTELRANHLRNIGKHIVNLITAQRPAFDCQASNLDYESEVQCQLGQSILDYDMKDKRLEDIARQVVEYAVRYGEGWGLKAWDTSAGEPWGIDPMTGRPIFSGALRYSAFAPNDVVRDVHHDGTQPLPWVMIRRWVNKYDLAAKYPGKEKEVSGAWDRLASGPRRCIFDYQEQILGLMHSDEVEVFEFYHDRTEALPAGRRCLFTAGGALEDGPLPYDRMPLFPVRAGVQEGTNFSYSFIFDLLPLQLGVDALVSTVASNQAAFGVQSILTPKGFGVDVTQLSKGLQAISYDPGIGEPKPLNLVQTAPETFTFLNLLVSYMETLSGVSSVVRGDPQASLKSGSALAMVASQALQYTVDLQAAYVGFMETISTGAIEDYKRFADTPQVTLIVGKSNRTRMKEWSSQDISRITRVTVDIGNALSKTLAGRSEMATQLVQAGLVKDPREYLEVLTTGRLEPVTQGGASEMLLIRAENERLSEGTQCLAVAIDDHVLHVKEHKTVLASPGAREDEMLVKATLDHIQQHLVQLREVDPLILGILGIPIPPDNQGTLPPGSTPPPGTPKPPGPMGDKKNPPGSAEPTFVPGMPTIPQPPVNPGTGARASAPVAAPPPPGVGG